jgi:hypothetical protein
MYLLNMKGVSISTTFFFIFSAFTVFCIVEAVINIPGNETIPAVLMFGDSIVDTGNNNNIKSIVKCNFPPYGREFKGGISTGRFSNGKVPSDFLGLKSLSLSLYALTKIFFFNKCLTFYNFYYKSVLNLM